MSCSRVGFSFHQYLPPHADQRSTSLYDTGHREGQPIIDSVEFYAQPRSQLEFLKSYQLEDVEQDESSSKALYVEQLPSADLLASCMESMLALQSVRPSQRISLSKESRDTMSRIVQQTSLDSGTDGSLRALTIQLLKAVVSDATERTSFVDEATLRVSCTMLRISSFPV